MCRIGERWLSLYMSQVANQVGAYLSCDKEYFYFPLDGMLVHRSVTPQH